MKNIVESIKNINEAREVSYRVSLSDATDNQGLPINVTMTVAKTDQKTFEDWLQLQEGNTIAHADGGNIEF